MPRFCVYVFLVLQLLTISDVYQNPIIYYKKHLISSSHWCYDAVTVYFVLVFHNNLFMYLTTHKLHFVLPLYLTQIIVMLWV